MPPTDPPAESPLRRLASLKLGRPVHDWIRDRRPPRRSWRAIADELREATGGEIDVTPTTLLKWAPDPKDDEVDVYDSPPAEPPTERAAS